MRGIPVPFEPPAADLKMEVMAAGVRCYVFDTCCRCFSPEEKARTDRAVLSICSQAVRAEWADGPPPAML